MAWVRIDRYTPVTRLRKASQPKRSARSPGTRTTMRSWSGRLPEKAQSQGNESPPTTPKIWPATASSTSRGVGGRGWPAREAATMVSVRAVMTHCPTA
jgi:hypothetical protein